MEVVHLSHLGFNHILNFFQTIMFINLSKIWLKIKEWKNQKYVANSQKCPKVLKQYFLVLPMNEGSTS